MSPCGPHLRSSRVFTGLQGESLIKDLSVWASVSFASGNRKQLGTPLGSQARGGLKTGQVSLTFFLANTS